MVLQNIRFGEEVKYKNIREERKYALSFIE